MRWCGAAIAVAEQQVDIGADLPIDIGVEHDFQSAHAWVAEAVDLAVSHFSVQAQADKVRERALRVENP